MPREAVVAKYELDELLKGVERAAPASEAALREAEQMLGVALPEDYKDFLRASNGGEGGVGAASYVMLWGVEELAHLNQAYEVELGAPGFLAFGSNGGGEAFGFDTRSSPWRVVQIPFVGMAWDVAWPLGESFSAFIRTLHDAA